MTTLALHGREVETVFHLLGSHENDMTYALGWALSQAPTFLEAFLRDQAIDYSRTNDVLIRLQEHEDGGGYTDIEIELPGKFFLLVEAKRGWSLPGGPAAGSLLSAPFSIDGLR